MVPAFNLLHILCICYFFFNLNKSSANERVASQKQARTTPRLTFRNLCPYNKFCQAPPLKEILNPDLEPCCKICSCESDCYEIGNCCPDVPLLGNIPTKYTCKHLWNFGKNTEGIIYPDEDSYWHHVIDECPEKRSANSYLKCYNPKELKDYVIVSGTKTGKLYRNKHCAECNGIKEYVNLKLRVRCEDKTTMTNLKNVVERDLFVLEHCSLMSLPPERNFGLSFCTIKSKIITECNSTGKWDFLDREIEKGCKTTRSSQNMVFRARLGTFSMYTYFANVYCFLCNKAKSLEIIDTCDIEEEDGTEMKGGNVPLFGLIDDAKLWIAETTTSKAICESTHVWDTYKKSCRNFYCPRGHIPVYGSCKGLLNFYGYTLDIHFEVIMKGVTIASDSYLLKVLERRFKKEIGIDLECGTCVTSLYSGNNTRSQIFFQYMIFSNEKCPYDMLLQRIRKISLKKRMDHQLKYRNQTATQIVLNLKFEGTKQRVALNKLLAQRSYSFCRSVNNIDRSILQYCPSIILSYDEVYDLKLSYFSTGLSQPTNDSQSAMQVCVDSYFAAQKAKSSAVAVAAMCFTIFNLYSITILTLL